MNQQFGNQMGRMSNFGNQGGSNQGFAQGGFNQGVTQQQLNQIHQNSIFNGQSQLDNPQIQRIQQATISGEEQNPLRGGFGGGASMGMMMGGQQGMMGMANGNLMNQGNFGSGVSANMGNQGSQGGFAQANFGQGGFGQGVSQAQLNQIHQNSIFNGQSQPDNAQVQRIHQATISGEEQNPLRAGFGGGASMGMMMGNQQGMMGMTNGNLMNQGNFGSGVSANLGNQGSQGGFAQANFGQGGFGQGVSQAQLNQIHQNSIFNGQSQPDNAQVQRIQQATISGEEQNPLRAGFGGGAGMGMMMGGQQGMMGMTSGNLMNQGNFGSGVSANMGNQGSQNGFAQANFGQGGFGQGVSQAQLNQIHQNSIFNGQSQPDNAQVQRIQQATISGEEQNPLRAGFGGSSMGMMGGQQGMMSMMGGQQGQGFVNPSALNAVLNADAGIRDQQGPNRYPASMYTGSNQYDNVNQSVLNQMTRSF